MRFSIRNGSSRGQRRMVVGVLAAAAVGLTVWALPATAKPAKQAKPASAKVITTVLVTMGKPSEFAFTLNKFSNLPVGQIMFKVTNKGVISHNFKICKAAFTAKALGTSCVGATTKTLKKGTTQTITVVVSKAGKYMFLCSVAGHAKNGMRGLLGVKTVVTAKEMHGTVTTTTIGQGGPPPPPVGVGTTCTTPTPSTFAVGMGNYFFTGVPPSVHCGSITVNATVVGTNDEGHNITFAGNPAGNIVVGPGSTSQTVTLNPGVVSYQCDVGIHAGQGMLGAITVTN